MSHEHLQYLVECQAVDGKKPADVVVRFTPEGAFAESDGFGGRRRLSGGEWVTIGDQRVRVQDPKEVEEGPRSANWTRPELLVSTPDEGRIRRLRTTLPTAEGSDLLIGRSGKKNDITLSDEHVSRRHMRIVVRGGRYLVEDLGSRWGTYLNDERVSSPTPLAHGDEVRIGKSVLRFVKFSDGFDFASTAGSSESAASQAHGPSWKPKDVTNDAMTITATTLLVSPDNSFQPLPPPPPPPNDADENASVSQRLTNWMRRKK